MSWVFGKEDRARVRAQRERSEGLKESSEGVTREVSETMLNSSTHA